MIIQICTFFEFFHVFSPRKAKISHLIFVYFLQSKFNTFFYLTHTRTFLRFAVDYDSKYHLTTKVNG
jgi:hypothetical protein